MPARPGLTLPNSMHPRATGPRLRVAREALGLKAAEIADAIGCDRSYWSRMERGINPVSAVYAFRLSERFGVTMDYIFRGTLDGLPDRLRGEIFARKTDL